MQYELRLTALLAVTACGEKEIDTTTVTAPIGTRIILSETDVRMTFLNESHRLLATVIDDKGNEIDAPVVYWHSANESVVTVDEDGFITAVSNGTATIYAETAEVRAETAIQVEQTPFGIEVYPGSVSFHSVGEIRILTSVVVDAGGSEIFDPEIVWQSSDNTVVSVDETGRATSMGHGAASIFAHAHPLSAEIPAEVVLFALGENGVTVLCPSAPVNAEAEVNGIIYTKQDRDGLDALVTSQDWGALERTCTSGIEDMSHLFENREDFNRDIGSWDTSTVNQMAYMFHNASTFDQNLEFWCVRNLSSPPIGFDSGAGHWTLAKPVWGTCP